MISCPACSFNERNIKRNSKKYTVFECKNCHLNFCSEINILNLKNVIDTDPDFFHGISESYERQVDVARIIVPKRLKAYGQFLDRPVRSILEIGCATGAYATAFNEQGIRYVGLEVESSLAAKAKINTGLDIREGNFLDQKEFEEFDVVFASQVFEHIVTPNLFLKNACLAAPKGLIHIDVPNHNSLTSTIRKIISRKDYGFIQPPYHMIAYDKRSFSNLITNFGLKTEFLCAKSNDDKIWGQLIARKSISLSNLIYSASKILEMGSLLTFVGRPPKI
jgi:2-polyprenyl-3-methyl-5-hydroxy-6-metoxy-1,4-benzoquinol methylase